MKPSIITLFIGLLLLACKPINQPELCSGIIVGTICCLDTVNQRTMQGYYIITDKNDSILTFNNEIKVLAYVGTTGIYGIDNHEIPFEFTYNLLEPANDDYIHYILPVSNALFPPMLYPIEHFKQALVKPLN